MMRGIQRLQLLGAACVIAMCALPLQAQTTGEIQVSTVGFGDIEFDWGRDGVFCATCNFGQTNARFNWTTVDGDIYVGHLDPTTGAFTPQEGNNELVDTHGYFWKQWGNGPEWAFSTQNGQVQSELVYTRHQIGKNVTGFSDAAYAQMVNGKWVPRPLPGSINNGTNGSGAEILPEGSQCNTDAVPIAIFHNVAQPAQAFTELVTSAPGTVPVMTTFGDQDNGIGERWIPCTHQLLFQGSILNPTTNGLVQQVFWYDADTGVTQQLTTNTHGKHTAFMFQAPDFADSYIMFTVSDKLEIDVYQQTGTLANGAPQMTLVNQIRSPDKTEPYINSPEPFINCTPICTTYVFMTLSATTNSQTGHSLPNGLAVAALNPAAPLFKVLVPASALPAAQRLDPEYYITANGPVLYYQLGTVETATKPFHNLGEFFIDMGLGVPSGSCVGSSAQDGLIPGC